MLVNAAVNLTAARAVNAIMRNAARRSQVIEWGLQQGMHVMGARTPFEYRQLMRRYTVA